MESRTIDKEVPRLRQNPSSAMVDGAPFTEVSPAESPFGRRPFTKDEKGMQNMDEMRNGRRSETTDHCAGESADSVDKPARDGKLLDSRQLCDRAKRKTGLKDFGEPCVEPPLTVLVRSLETEANLHALGRRLMKIHLSAILEARLKFARTYAAQCGEFSASPLQAPIFITGMPRSGSTFLHELLAQDPSLRAPRIWEVMLPASAAEPDAGWRDLRVWRAAWCLWWFRRLAPRADAVYPMRARTPHECMAVHGYTFLSEEFLSTCHIPGYKVFLRAADLRPAYAWEKRFLQFLQSRGPAARWLLKSPDHAYGLEALFSVFPDAVIIQTHRSPFDSLRSAIQLTEVLQSLYARPQGREQIATTEAHSLALRMERLMRFRDNHPELAKRFVDVNYTELTHNPLAVVRRIFSHIGVPPSSGTLETIQQLARNRSAYKGRRTAPGAHQVGLDPPAQMRLFGEYCRRFRLPVGQPM